MSEGDLPTPAEIIAAHNQLEEAYDLKCTGMSKTEPGPDDLNEYRERVDAIIERERDILDALAE